MIGTRLPPVAAFFHVEYEAENKEIGEVYQNWQQFLMEKGHSGPIRTLNALGQYFLGSATQLTNQQVMFWVRDPNVKLSSLEAFSVEFKGVTPTEYTAATIASKYIIWIIIGVAVLVFCCCLCRILAKNSGDGSGGGFIFFGGGDYGGNNGGGGGGFGDFGGGGGYGDGGGGY